AIEGVGVADIAVRSTDGDVEETVALAEAGLKQVCGLELVASLVLGGDLQRGHHRRRQATVVFLDAGGHGVVQQGGLYGFARRNQRWPCVLDGLDQAVLVVRVLRANRILDAAFLDHSVQRRYLFGAATETDADDANLRLGVFVDPLLRLSAELVVSRFNAAIEGIAGDAIDIASNGVVLCERALDVAAADIVDAILSQCIDL